MRKYLSPKLVDDELYGYISKLTLSFVTGEINFRTYINELRNSNISDLCKIGLDNCSDKELIDFVKRIFGYNNRNAVTNLNGKIKELDLFTSKSSTLVDLSKLSSFFDYYIKYKEGKITKEECFLFLKKYGFLEISNLDFNDNVSLSYALGYYANVYSKNVLGKSINSILKMSESERKRLTQNEAKKNINELDINQYSSKMTSLFLSYLNGKLSYEEFLKRVHILNYNYIFDEYTGEINNELKETLFRRIVFNYFLGNTQYKFKDVIKKPTVFSKIDNNGQNNTIFQKLYSYYIDYLNLKIEKEDLLQLANQLHINLSLDSIDGTSSMHFIEVLSFYYATNVLKMTSEGFYKMRDCSLRNMKNLGIEEKQEKKEQKKIKREQEKIKREQEKFASIKASISSEDLNKLKNIYNAFNRYYNFEISFQEYNDIIESNKDINSRYVKIAREIDNYSRFYAEYFLGISKSQYDAMKDRSILFQNGYSLFEQYANGEISKDDWIAYEKKAGIPVERAAKRYAEAAGISSEFQELKNQIKFFRTEREVYASKYYNWLFDASNDDYFNMYFMDLAKRIIEEKIDINCLYQDCCSYVNKVYTSENSINGHAINGTSSEFDKKLEDLRNKVRMVTNFIYEIKTEKKDDLLEYSDYLISTFIDSGQTIQEFIADYNLSLSSFHRMVNYLKDHNPKLFNKYNEEIEKHKNFAFKSLCEKVCSIRAAIKENKKTFSLSDYYSIFPISYSDPTTFFGIAKRVLNRRDYYVVNNVLDKLFTDAKNKKMSRVDINTLANKYNISTSDIEQVLSFMNLNEIPVTGDLFLHFYGQLRTGQFSDSDDSIRFLQKYKNK